MTHTDTHGIPIEDGDRVLIVAYGFGARLIDVGLIGRVTGRTAKRLRVEFTEQTPSAGGCDRQIGDVFTVAGCVVAVLERADLASRRQEANVR